MFDKGFVWWFRWWRICGRPVFDPWIGKITWIRELTPVLLPGEFHGQRRAAEERRRGWQEEKGMTKDEMVERHQWLEGHEFEQALGVGNGLEAGPTAAHGVTKSWTWLRDWTELNWTELTELTHTHTHLKYTKNSWNTTIRKKMLLKWTKIWIDITLEKTYKWK